MDNFVFLPLIGFLVASTLMCCCFWIFACYAKKHGRFATVNRSGPSHGMVNRSGPTHVIVNRSGPSFGTSAAFGTGVVHNEPVYQETVANDPPQIIVDRTPVEDPPYFFNPPLNDTIVNNNSRHTTHTTANVFPPSYTEATGIPVGTRHQRHQNEYCDSGFRSHGVKDDGNDSGGKCDIGRDDSGDKSYDSNVNGGMTYDSGGGCDSGGDTGGGDTGGGGDSSATN